MRKNSAVPPSHGGWPAWYDGKNINEVLFCEEFLAAHPMKCIRGRLFTVDGAVEDEAVVAADEDDEDPDSVTPIAAAVDAPTRPSAVSPLLRWKRSTALRVASP